MVRLVTIRISIIIAVCGLFVTNKEAYCSLKGQCLISHKNVENAKPWQREGEINDWFGLFSKVHADTIIIHCNAYFYV